MNKIYLDYAATTPLDSQVKKAMEPYFRDVFGNPGSLHSFGQEASAAVFAARRLIAEAIGANYKEIIFTGSATEANNLALRGTIKYLKSQKSNLKSFKQPRIIVSAIEHESILETAKDLEREGVEVIYLPVSKEGFVDLKKLEQSLNERTVLVSVMYANNEVGTIEPIHEIDNIIKDFKATKYEKNTKLRNNEGEERLSYFRKNFVFRSEYPLFHTDAVQALQYLDCGVLNLGVDLMTLSAHKIYGPKGIGALYVRNSKFEVRNPKQIPNSKTQNPKVSNFDIRISDLRAVSPLVTGGGQEEGLRSGTENVPYIVGFGKAVELAKKMRLKETKRVGKLRDYLWNGIKKIYPKAEINGAGLASSDLRLANNLNVYLPNQPASDLLIKLDLAGVAAAAGSACVSRALEPSYIIRSLGLGEKRASESIRFTLGRPTAKREIDGVLKVIKRILR